MRDEERAYTYIVDIIPRLARFLIHSGGRTLDAFHILMRVIIFIIGIVPTRTEL